MGFSDRQFAGGLFAFCADLGLSPRGGRGAQVGSGSLGGDESVEWWVEFVGGDGVVADVELLEDGLVEEPAAVVGGLPVCLLEVVEEVESGFERVGSDVELSRSSGSPHPSLGG